MAIDPVIQTTKTLIAEAFEINTIEESVTETELFDMLADQVAYWITHKIEFLFSLMYRLDIDEAKVEAALHPLATEPANVGLAKLILERQKKRAYTKIHFPPLPVDEEWAF